MASAPGQIAGAFLARHRARLAEIGIEVGVVVLDENQLLRAHPLRQRWRMAGRQARISGCTHLTGFLRLLTYEALVRQRGAAPAPDILDDASSGVEVVHAPSLNAAAAITAIQRAGCDIVCLMGARILTARTLDAIGVPIVNIHSSDPAWVRGGPVVVWEVLAGRQAISLNVHQVLAALDAGAILASEDQPVLYRGGLGATTRATMEAAAPRVADLFAAVVAGARDGKLQERRFDPGTLRVTPGVLSSLRADRLCRVRTGSSARAYG